MMPMQHLVQSSFWDCFFIGDIKKEGFHYVR